MDANDFNLEFVADLAPPLFWTALGSSSQWNVLRDDALVLLTLPVAEVENERAFSIRKYVTGDRGGRSKNDIVTARVRTRMEETRTRKANE
jgi:hypothetical protein